MALNRPILERLARIGDEVVPIGSHKACRKKIRIVRRLAHQGKNFPAPWIQGDNRAGMITDHLFSGTLKIKIDGRDDVVSRNEGLFLQLPHLAPEAVHDDAFESV